MWPIWAQYLQRWGLAGIAAYFLEAAGPLTILGAQVLYLGQPFFNLAMPSKHLEALVQLFEDKNEAQTFAAFLREGKSP